MTPLVTETLTCVALGILGGFTVGVGHAVLEWLWFKLLVALDKRGLVKRLAPSIAVTVTELQRESFWAVTLPHCCLFIGLAIFREGFIARAEPRLDVAAMWAFTWVVMALHDTWFVIVHSAMHRWKVLYRSIHQLHHSTYGDLTVFSTAFGDALDIAIIFPSFYALVMAYLYFQPRWNPCNFIFLGWAFNGVNMMGHSGYELPAWVYVPGSLGVLATPYAQRSIHHYIHHLDLRYNRSLYFTWWDRLFGTFRDTHPKITTAAAAAAA